VGHLPRADRGRRGLRRAGRSLRAGRFIALEGIDGSGKSTQARLLAEALQARGLPVTATREPGGTPLGERVREILLSGDPGALTPVAEATLFAAARAELVARVVQPALKAGGWVVSDRFVDSSLAYQGAARGMGVDLVLEINRPAVDGCLPDLSVVVDVAVAVAAGRRCASPDRIEAEGDGFQQRVADGYRELARRFPERVRLVPGEGSVEEVHAAVMDVVGAIA
jgi:dTMP kinase